jgi:MinD-like ATPase involved in chromosome partitioning or flagellar assembly
LILGIVDGIVTAYDMNTFLVKATLLDTKGCHTFAISEYNDMLVVANKKKISVYSWSTAPNIASAAAGAVSSGFILNKEAMNLSELPKSVTCIASSIIIGFKRTYDAMDIFSLSSIKILDVDKDQRMLSLEIPVSDLRPLSVLLSHGNQGLIFDLYKLLASQAPSTALSSTRLEWSSSPVSIHYMNPFIFSILSDSIEIHDSMSLASLQRIPIPVPTSSLTSSFSSSVSNMLSFSSCKVDPAIGLEHAYVSIGDQVFVFRMTPLPAQIMTLLDAYRFEDAINLCALCLANPQIRDIDVAGVHEKYALSLFQKGDFDMAIQHYIKAKATPQKVLILFPDLVPVVFYGYLGISSQSISTGTRAGSSGTSVSTSARMTGVVLTRAAAAMVNYCHYYRMVIKSKVEVAEKYKAASMTAATALENLETLVVSDWEDVLRIAEIIDTVLLCALINCSPSRRHLVIDLLSNASSPYKNRCHMESSATMLASQGNAYSEALLWLYRSHHEHKRVLVALTEERCVGAGAWTRDQFYHWTADYLRWLLYQDENKLTALVLNALRPVLEYDIELGFSVLTQSNTSKSTSSMTALASANQTLGGKGIEISDILVFLESAKIKAVSSLTPAQKKHLASLCDDDDRQPSEKKDYLFHADAKEMKFPLIHNQALMLAYLEYRIHHHSGSISTSMQLSSNQQQLYDDYISLLIKNIDINLATSHPNLRVLATDADPIIFYKIYRKKLQYFLQTCSDYHAEMLLASLPGPLQHEYAIILSKLRRDREVLEIYINKLNCLSDAEFYCDIVYHQRHDEHVYLLLMQVLLQADNPSSPNIDMAVQLAEKYYQRLDAVAFLKEIPPKISFAKLAKYLKLVIENATMNKHTMQVSTDTNTIVPHPRYLYRGFDTNALYSRLHISC